MFTSKLRSGARGAVDGPRLTSGGAVRRPWVSCDMDESSDAELLEHIRSGDRAAWIALVNRHNRRLRSVARSAGLDSSGVDDAVQGGWLKLLDHVDRIREPAALGGWLATVVRHEAIHLLKGRQREKERAERLGRLPERAQDAADVPALLAEDLQSVDAAFGRLSERCQQLLRLMFSSVDRSYKEISDTLGLPVGSLGPTRARCLEHLRGLMP